MTELSAGENGTPSPTVMAVALDPEIYIIASETVGIVMDDEIYGYVIGGAQAELFVEALNARGHSHGHTFFAKRATHLASLDDQALVGHLLPSKVS